MREQVEPNGGNARGHGDALFIDQRRQGLAIAHFVAGHHQLRPCNRTGIGITPGVNVEHRHDWQHHIPR